MSLETMGMRYKTSKKPFEYQALNVPGDSGRGYEDTKKNEFGATYITKGSLIKGKWDRIANIALPITLIGMSLFTRLYKIGVSDRVVWDEAHFGKFGGYYIKQTFYHDVHPPLAKMLVALSEYLVGFNGQFEFDSGATYPKGVNYKFMRQFNAMFGVMLVPFAYYTMLNFGSSKKIAGLAALFVTFDNALCTISRFILLDSMLLCFTAMSVYGISGLYSLELRRNKNPMVDPNDKEKNKWLLFTGLSLGLVLSSKWVGLFVYGLVGLYTLDDLYRMIGNSQRSHRFVSTTTFCKNFIIRAITLILVPLIVYLVSFKIHFMILNKSGPGDGTMPSLFQAHLRGIDLLHQPFDVAYGSKVTMRAAGGDYGLFHSHDSPIPGGSNNHQVTCYGHKDNNNEWLFFKEYTKEKNDESTRIGSEKNSDPETAMTTATGTDSIEYIKNKSIVRLRHVNTEGMLTVSRNHKWLLNSKYYEVSGRKKDVSGKEKDEKNDNWQIEIVGPKNENVVKALTVQFKLKHVVTGCYLQVTGNQLPAWGYEQSEVVCGFDGKEEHQIWNVENQWNQFLKNGNPKLAKQSFFKNFLYLNKAMARTNNGLVPDEDKIDDLASQPLDWPVLRYGIRMSGWEFHRHKYYMLGNPMLWWISSLSIVLGPIYMILSYIAHKRTTRNKRDSRFTIDDTYFYPSVFLWLGWFLHYLPFFIMGRVMYLHHYFPSLYFAILFLALQIGRFNFKIYRVVDLILISGVVITTVFVYFSPITFGFDYPNHKIKNRNWLSTWTI